MKYCSHCGVQMEESVKYCTRCGTPMHGSVGQTPPYGQPYVPTSGYYGHPQNLLEKLCGRLRVSAITLLITAILQVLGSLSCIGIGIAMILIGAPLFGDVLNQYGTYINYYTTDFEYNSLVQFGSGAIIVGAVVCFVISAFMAVVCIVNFITAARTFGYIKQIRQSPIGIVPHFQSAGKPISVLVLNILCGGVLGIIGAVFALVARSLVMENQKQFYDLEQQN